MVAPGCRQNEDQGDCRRRICSCQGEGLQCPCPNSVLLSSVSSAVVCRTSIGDSGNMTWNNLAIFFGKWMAAPRRRTAEPPKHQVGEVRGH